MVVGKAGPRYFNFAADRGTWYDPTEWVPAVNQVAQANVVAWSQGSTTGNPWRNAPWGWPQSVPRAFWVWDRDTRVSAAPVGDVYLRREFTTAVACSITVYASADESFTVYLDGERILHQSGQGTNAWQNLYSATTDVAAGGHVLGMRARNTSSTAAAICTAFQVGDAKINAADILLCYTGDGQWKINPYPNLAPGLTPGEILRTLIEEAKDRGVDSFLAVDYDFTDATDSNGAPWTQVYDWAFNVGDEYTAVIQKLEEIAVEVRFNPETFALQAFNAQGTDRSTGAGAIAFRGGLNLTEATEDSLDAVKTVYLMQYQDNDLAEVLDQTGDVIGDGISAPIGITTVASSDPPPRVEGFYQADTGLTLSTSTEVAQRMLALVRLPKEQATVTIADVPGLIPWKDFQAGDWILGPGANGEKRRRIVSIGASITDTGQAAYEVELDTISQTREDALAKFMANLGNLTVIGSLVAGSPVPGNQTTINNPGTTNIYPQNPCDPADPYYNPVLCPTNPKYDPCQDPTSSTYPCDTTNPPPYSPCSVPTSPLYPCTSGPGDCTDPKSPSYPCTNPPGGCNDPTSPNYPCVTTKPCSDPSSAYYPCKPPGTPCSDPSSPDYPCTGGPTTPGGGDTPHFVQPDEPLNVPIGTLWYDTDADPGF